MFKIIQLFRRAENSSNRLFIAGGIILLAGLYLWYGQVASSPQNVFTSMLNNNLKSLGVTRTIAQDSNASKLTQTMQLSFGPSVLIHGTTVLAQISTVGSSTVKTETIGTTDADYLRYTDIVVPASAVQNKKLNLGHVLNVWSKQPKSANESGRAGQFLQEALLGLVPQGNLKPKDREAVVKAILSAYTINFKQVETKQESGRNIYVYTVVLHPDKYALALQAYVKALGIGELTDLDVSNYQNLNPLTLKFSVDVFSRQLVKIEYTDRSRQETFSGFGYSKVAEIPTQTITFAELQSRLQSVR